VGVEALVRWQHPERGLLPPEAFLGSIEDAALDEPLGEWVIDTALRQLQAWREAGLAMACSVNISPRHLLLPHFASRLETLLAQHPGVSPRLLELEILESAALCDLARAAETLKQCKQLGVRFSLDDFGTGYSSLAMLRHLPVDVLKIDQSFVRDMLTDRSDLALVASVVRLAETFGREVIAEGVETQAHGEALLAIGCRRCQGYFIARPMPARSLPAWVASWRATAPWDAPLQAEPEAEGAKAGP
jgi:EAL domain-containing protein (putative c-di-GMP-specific phosphodiesterase class I)